MTPSLPRCSFTDIERLWCPCDLCNGFTMTDAEQAVLDQHFHPELRQPPKPQRIRRWRKVEGDQYAGRTYGNAQPVKVYDQGNVCATPYCGRLAGDEYVCPTCIERFEVACGDVPALVEDLEVAAQKRANIRGWLTTAQRPNPESRVGEMTDLGELLRTLGRTRPDLPQPATLLAELDHQLTTAIRLLCEHVAQPLPAIDTAQDKALWLLSDGWTRSLALSPAGGDIVADVVKARHRALACIDNAPERSYIGLCTCGKPMYEYTNRAVHVCTYCGTEHDTAEAWAGVMDRVRTHRATTRQLVVWSRIAGHHPVTLDAVKGYVRRGRLLSCGTNDDGTAVYWIGDLLDILSPEPEVLDSEGSRPYSDGKIA